MPDSIRAVDDSVLPPDLLPALCWLLLQVLSTPCCMGHQVQTAGQRCMLFWQPLLMPLPKILCMQ
jgi:hypothetical protein